AGLLNLQYDFVQVKLTVVDGATVESKELGLYALEEFFDKQLVERNQRREGVILKVDEDPLWQERADFIAQRMDLKDLEYLSQVQYEDLNILPFSAKKVMEDPNLHRQFLTARELFQDFIEGKRLISEVFDVEKLAKYNAICNLLGANHALLAHNYRVYYNPINSRLEPIGFDANALVKEWYPYSYHHADRDPNYQAAYARALEEVTGQEYIDAILSRKDLRKQIELLQAAYPGEFQWDPGVL
ncbi:MAG: CotH kinase family protein, partial [Saprospiraceae bacterium]|nr:CotH kinase family protein [Saprospiraceae bacterium]MCB0624399.1 CotH kinase family protein [Saprospiraceae bacterium]